MDVDLWLTFKIYAEKRLLVKNGQDLILEQTHSTEMASLLFGPKIMSTKERYNFNFRNLQHLHLASKYASTVAKTIVSKLTTNASCGKQEGERHTKCTQQNIISVNPKSRKYFLMN